MQFKYSLKIFYIMTIKFSKCENKMREKFFFLSFYSLNLHWLKSFNLLNAYSLCRHLDDADFCGQGPDLIQNGDPIRLESHWFFFARKFPTKDIYTGE